MFTKRHEQELSEIKALMHDLNRRFEEIVEQIGRIQETQDQHAAQRRDPAPAGRPSGAKRARRREKGKGGRTGKRAQPALRSGADEE